MLDSVATVIYNQKLFDNSLSEPLLRTLNRHRTSLPSYPDIQQDPSQSWTKTDSALAPKNSRSSIPMIINSCSNSSRTRARRVKCRRVRRPQSRCPQRCMKLDADLQTAAVHDLTETCFKKCITNSITTGKLASKEDSCLTNCVERFMDSNLAVLKHLETLRSHQ